MSNASAEFELNTLPRIHKPSTARIATAKKYAMALRHLWSKACPNPGTSHPAAAATKISAGLVEFFCVSAMCSAQQREYARLHGARDPRFPAVYVDIHFAANSEFLQINAGLNRKTGLRQNRTRIVGLQAIHIGAVAVNLLSNAVAGAMHKIFAVARGRNDVARSAIHLPSLDRTAFGQLLAEKGDRMVARLAHMQENAFVLLRNFCAQIAHPGDVVIDAAGTLHFSPNIE